MRKSPLTTRRRLAIFKRMRGAPVLTEKQVRKDLDFVFDRYGF